MAASVQNEVKSQVIPFIASSDIGAPPMNSRGTMMGKKSQRGKRVARTAIATVTATATLVSFAGGPARAWEADAQSTTPIKHVILIVGENRTFDHLYGTYEAKPGETVSNILSKGIVNADGTPGPNFAKAAQYQATDTTVFALSPQPKT